MSADVKESHFICEEVLADAIGYIEYASQQSQNAASESEMNWNLMRVHECSISLEILGKHAS